MATSIKLSQKKKGKRLNSGRGVPNKTHMLTQTFCELKPTLPWDQGSSVLSEWIPDRNTPGPCPLEYWSGLWFRRQTFKLWIYRQMWGPLNSCSCMYRSPFPDDSTAPEPMHAAHWFVCHENCVMLWLGGDSPTHGPIHKGHSPRTWL